MRHGAAPAALGLLLAAGAVCLGRAGATGPELVFTQVPYRAEYHGREPGGFLRNRAAERGSRITLLRSDGTIAVLTPEFASAADPDVSFDGKRILFAGRQKAQDVWNIWEMDANGANKRQITRNLGNCREPAYLATSSITPPDFVDKVRWATFVSDAAGVYEEGNREQATALYVTNIEPIAGRGTVVWRATFNLSSDFSPTVLKDGRTLFTSRQLASASPGAPARYPLLASNWDGTGLNLFCDELQGAPFKTMAAEMPDRTLVFVESDTPSAAGGRLARVSFRRPLHSYALLSRSGGDYLYPHPLADGILLVAWSDGKSSYGIHTFDFEKGGPGTRVFDDSRWEDLDAQPVVSRSEPTGLISAVVDSLDWGELHCINIYESDRPEARQIREGEVKRVRLVTGIPARMDSAAGRASRGALPVETRVLGEAPVEPDGSFFVRIPGDTAFRIEMLNGQGRVVQSMSRWIWVRRGTSRGCIGCHENKELAPENRATDALRKGQPHVLMPGH